MAHQGTDWEAYADAGLRALVKGYAGLLPERPLQVGSSKVLLRLLCCLPYTLHAQLEQDLQPVCQSSVIHQAMLFAQTIPAQCRSCMHASCCRSIS